MQLSPLYALHSASGAHMFSQPPVLQFPGISVLHCVEWVCKSCLPLSHREMLRRRAHQAQVWPESERRDGKRMLQRDGGLLWEGKKNKREGEFNMEEQWERVMFKKKTTSERLTGTVYVFDRKICSCYNWMWMYISWIICKWMYMCAYRHTVHNFPQILTDM